MNISCNNNLSNIILIKKIISNIELSQIINPFHRNVYNFLIVSIRDRTERLSPPLFTRENPFISENRLPIPRSIAPSLFTWNLLILDFLYLPVCPFVCLVDARYWRISASGTRISIINAATPTAEGAANEEGRECRVRNGEVRKIDPPLTVDRIILVEDVRTGRRGSGFVIVGE